ncbi:hypothetical protein EYF80_039920 [Liparis tanakae]|uniref:Uncharacterized protein n=1 Tax=Liparis tanakae TaxID=230148 RepID=A0A4Z2G8Q5_9TELE|nr:hypothetical protein EYF80_039920 [Liparis tanakae]
MMRANPTLRRKTLVAHLQCVATHSLLQYSLSQSWLSTAGLVQPARIQVMRPAASAAPGTGATFTSTSIWERRRGVRQAAVRSRRAARVCGAELTPSSTSPTSSSSSSSSSAVASADCPASIARPDAGAPPADVTMMESACRDADAATTLICSGGGAVAPAPPPRGLACRGGGAWACTICCSRGGREVLCICCSGGGWRGEEEEEEGADIAVTVTAPEGSCICLMMILATVGGAAAAGGAWGLMAPVRERVVTCGRSRMMLEVQMLVMVFSSGLYCCDRVERAAREEACAAMTTGTGAAGGGDGGDGDVSMTSMGAYGEDGGDGEDGDPLTWEFLPTRYSVSALRLSHMDATILDTSPKVALGFCPLMAACVSLKKSA